MIRQTGVGEKRALKRIQTALLKSIQIKASIVKISVGLTMKYGSWNTNSRDFLQAV
jgi:hypothetical protein